MPGEPDILDSLIAIAIILFILSVIVEKITQLIRRYSPFIKTDNNLLKKTFRPYWRNIRSRQTGNRELDKKVEREVTSLSFFIGFIIVIFFKVDLFKMIAYPGDPRDVLFWKADFCQYLKSLTFFKTFLFICSLALTGFFLSFGSKFFHDLIDTLLQVKNLKRKLVDEETYKVESTEQLDEYLNRTYSDIIQSAIDQNRSVLQSPNAVSPPMHGRIRRDGRLIDCIDIHLSGNNRGTIPQTVQAKLGAGKTVNIVVHAIFDVEVPKASILQGDTTANDKTPAARGTICCKVNRGGREYLLTCSHVCTGGTGENNNGPVTPAQSARIHGLKDGNFIWAIRTDRFDMALLSPDSADFSYAISPAKERNPVPSDITHTKVRVVCRQNQGGKAEIKHGVVVNDRMLDPIIIQYDDDKYSLSNLMVISNVNTNDDDYSGVTIPGDSGACVYDEANRPIGMIVAGSNKFSFAMPMGDVLNKLTATIIK